MLDLRTQADERIRICVILGHLIVAFFMTAIGRGGAVYHLGFPTLARSSFGIFGSLW